MCALEPALPVNLRHLLFFSSPLARWELYDKLGAVSLTSGRIDMTATSHLISGNRRVYCHDNHDNPRSAGPADNMAKDFASVMIGYYRKHGIPFMIHAACTRNEWRSEEEKKPSG